MMLDILALNSTSQCLFDSPSIICQTNKIILKYSKSLQMVFNLLEKEGNIAYSKIMFIHDTGRSCFDSEHAIVPN